MSPDLLAPFLFLLGGLLIGASLIWYLRLWVRGEREDPRGVQRLPRLFLLGFVLAVVTGPLVLWLVINDQRRVSATEPIHPSLQEVLEDRLPDAAIQQARHEELIQTIRGLHGIPAGGWRPGGARIALEPELRIPRGADLLPVFSCLLLLIAGTIILQNMQGLLGRFLGLLVCAGAVAVLFVGVPDLLTLRAVLPPGEPTATSVPAPPPAPAEVRPKAPEIHIEYLGRLGPFPSARHQMDEDAALAALGGSLPRIKSWAESDRLGFLLLIGGADRRPLQGQAAETYASNAGLAQARAAWVKDLLLRVALADLDGSQLIPLTSGPTQIAPHPSLTELATDRSVQIYACWREVL